MGIHYEDTARTLAYRLTREQHLELGITWDPSASVGRWYHRLWRAKKRMLQLLDPWYATGKRSILNAAQYARAKEQFDADREDRLKQVSRALLDASVALLPQRYRDAYRGDVALDSTLIAIQGNCNPSKEQDHLARSNVDYTSGIYRHEHRDDPFKKPSIPGFELDVVQMVDARGYDKHRSFARLITGIGFHVPAAITVGPREAMLQHTRAFTQRGIYIADRAFNNLESESFQLAVRQEGLEASLDLRSDQTGHQASVHGLPVIMVDGSLYVHYMPANLRDVTRHVSNNTVNPATGEAYTRDEVETLVAAREPYRLKAHGKPDRDGFQRFTYPDPRRYVAFDPATGKRLRGITLSGSVTIPRQLAIIKHLQKYPWHSADWHRTYGQRNQVESANKHLKEVRFTDLSEPKKRTARGYAVQFLASALACVAANIRRLVSALRDEFRTPTPSTRSRRRTDARGQRLPILPRNTRDLAPPG